MRLDRKWVFRLGDDSEEVVVREKVEPGEFLPLLLEVVAELLDDLVQFEIGILKLGEESVDVAYQQHV